MTLDRRNFLAASAASTLVASAARATPAATRADPVIVNTLGTLFGMNTPVSTKGKPVLVDTQPEMITDATVRDALMSGVSAINMTLGYVSGDVDPFEHSVADIGRWNRIIAQRSANLLHVRKADDILKAHKEKKIGVIYGFQNSAMLGTQLERVDIFADLGVRIIQLTYNVSNTVGDGCMVPENRPLTAFGHAAVERLAEMRVLCDLSHSGQQTCLDATRRSTMPVAITHTGCRALVDVPRNKTDEEMRLVAERGGYIGIYFMPFLTKSGPAKAVHVAEHIEHAIKICGEDHVGIGTDGTTTPVPDLAAYLEGQRKYVEQRKQQGIAAPGENADAPFFVVDLNGPEQFRKLGELLRSRGHSAARVDKILGGNFVRLARDVWS